MKPYFRSELEFPDYEQRRKDGNREFTMMLVVLLVFVTYLVFHVFTASVAAQKSVPYIDTVGDTLRWPAGEWIVPFTGLKTSHLVRTPSGDYVRVGDRVTGKQPIERRVGYDSISVLALGDVDSCWYEPTPCPDPDYYPGGGCLVLHVEKKCKPVGPDTTRFYAKVDTVGWWYPPTGWVPIFYVPYGSLAQRSLYRDVKPILDTTWLPKVQVYLDSCKYRELMEMLR